MQSEKLLYFNGSVLNVCVCVFSLLLQQSCELQQRAVCSPGFLWTAILCYVRLGQLFVEGQTSDLSNSQVTEPHMIAHLYNVTLL